MVTRSAEPRALPASADSSMPAVSGRLAVVGLIVVVALGVPMLESGLAAEVIYWVVAWALVVIAWLVAPRSPQRDTAMLLAFGITLTQASDVIWHIQSIRLDDEIGLSLADVGWVVAQGSILLAIVKMTPGSYRRRTDPDGLVDLAAVFMVAMLIQWELALGGLFREPDATVLERTVWMLYPTLGAMSLALLVRGVVTRRLSGSGTWFVVAGASVWLFADTVWSALGVPVDYVGYLDLVWLAGSVSMCAAIGRLGPRQPVVADGATGTRSSHLVSVMVALVPLAVPGTILLLADARGARTNPYAVHIVTVVLLVLAFTRVLRVLQAEREARTRLASEQQYARRVAMLSSDAVVVLDTDGVIIRDSPNIDRLVGYPGADPLGHNAFEWIVADDQAEARAAFDRCLGVPGAIASTEFRLSDATGVVRWFAARMSDRSTDPAVGGVIVTLHDITERKEIERTVTHVAFHDGLTGLPNRNLFGDRAKQAVHRAARTRRDIAVLFLDLDGFKEVNDRYGHETGDELLCQIAERLDQAVRETDTVARMGGDEFAVLIESSFDATLEAQQVADRILEAVTAPFALTNGPASVGVSIGISVGDHTTTVSSLLRDADAAMYRAKATGKNRWVLHRPGPQLDTMSGAPAESGLAAAMRNDELVLSYRPVVDLITRRIAGFEASVTWANADSGALDIARLVEIAEHDDLIAELGRWVLDEACAAAVRWRSLRADCADLSVGVDLWLGHLASSRVIDDVIGALGGAGLPPRALMIELSERSLAEYADLVVDRSRELRAVGVRLVLDDFGVGEASHTDLRRMPIGAVKIHRSLVDGIDDGDDLPSNVRGLIGIGRMLDLRVGADGIDRPRQLDLLCASGCVGGQGSLFSEPLDACAVDDLLLSAGAALPTPV